jgi:hypothetical protein
MVNTLAHDSGGGPGHDGKDCDEDGGEDTGCTMCDAARAWRAEYLRTHDAWANEERAIRARKGGVPVTPPETPGVPPYEQLAAERDASIAQAAEMAEAISDAARLFPLVLTALEAIAKVDARTRVRGKSTDLEWQIRHWKGRARKAAKLAREALKLGESK